MDTVSLQPYSKSKIELESNSNKILLGNSKVIFIILLFFPNLI